MRNDTREVRTPLRVRQALHITMAIMVMLLGIYAVDHAASILSRWHAPAATLTDPR